MVVQHWVMRWIDSLADSAHSFNSKTKQPIDPKSLMDQVKVIRKDEFVRRLVVNVDKVAAELEIGVDRVTGKLYSVLTDRIGFVPLSKRLPVPPKQAKKQAKGSHSSRPRPPAQAKAGTKRKLLHSLFNFLPVGATFAEVASTKGNAQDAIWHSFQAHSDDNDSDTVDTILAHGGHKTTVELAGDGRVSPFCPDTVFAHCAEETKRRVACVASDAKEEQLSIPWKDRLEGIAKPKFGIRYQEIEFPIDADASLKARLLKTSEILLEVDKSTSLFADSAHSSPFSKDRICWEANGTTRFVVFDNTLSEETEKAEINLFEREVCSSVVEGATSLMNLDEKVKVQKAMEDEIASRPPVAQTPSWEEHFFHQVPHNKRALFEFGAPQPVFYNWQVLDGDSSGSAKFGQLSLLVIDTADLDTTTAEELWAKAWSTFPVNQFADRIFAGYDPENLFNYKLQCALVTSEDRDLAERVQQEYARRVQTTSSCTELAKSLSGVVALIESFTAGSELMRALHACDSFDLKTWQANAPGPVSDIYTAQTAQAALDKGLFAYEFKCKWWEGLIQSSGKQDADSRVPKTVDSEQVKDHYALVDGGPPDEGENDPVDVVGLGPFDPPRGAAIADVHSEEKTALTKTIELLTSCQQPRPNNSFGPAVDEGTKAALEKAMDALKQSMEANKRAYDLLQSLWCTMA